MSHHKIHHNQQPPQTAQVCPQTSRQGYPLQGYPTIPQNGYQPKRNPSSTQGYPPKTPMQQQESISSKSVTYSYSSARGGTVRSHYLFVLFSFMRKNCYGLIFRTCSHRTSIIKPHLAPGNHLRMCITRARNHRHQSVAQIC